MSLDPNIVKKNLELVAQYKQTTWKTLYTEEKTLHLSLLSSCAELQQRAIVQVMRETFQSLDATYQMVQRFDPAVDVVAIFKLKRKFLKGSERILKAHEGNDSYRVLVESVKAQVLEMRAALDKEALLSFQPGLGIGCDATGRLKLVREDNRDLPEDKQKRIADSLQSLLSTEGVEENQLLKSARHLIQYAKQKNFQLLGQKIASDLKAREIQRDLVKLKTEIAEGVLVSTALRDHPELLKFIQDNRPPQDNGDLNNKSIALVIAALKDIVKKESASNPSDKLYPLCRIISVHSDRLWKFARTLTAYKEELERRGFKYPELSKQLQAEINQVHNVQEKLLEGLPALLKGHLAKGVEELKKRIAQESKTPFQNIEERLKSICSYETARLSVLYVAGDQLAYSSTMSFKPDIQTQVTAHIRQQMAEFWKQYASAPPSERGQWLQLASQFLGGLQKVAADYSKYPAFQTAVEAIAAEMVQEAKKQESQLTRELEAARTRPDVTVFDLWKVGVLEPKLPRAFIHDLAKRAWGARLADHLMEVYLSKGQETLNQQDLKWLIIAAAADVKGEDVRRYHEREGSRKFEELSSWSKLRFSTTSEKDQKAKICWTFLISDWKTPSAPLPLPKVKNWIQKTSFTQTV